MGQFKKVSRDLFLQKYERYLPTAFDESLTILEKVNKIIEMLIRYGQLSDELIDYLNQFKIEFDDKLKNNVDDIVDKMLNQWLKDGVLFNLIDDKYGSMRQMFEESFHYLEIDTEEFKSEKSLYYVTTIPPQDVKGNPIYLEKGYAKDTLCEGNVNGLENALEHATRHATSVTVNASIFNMDQSRALGVHIQNGVIHKGVNDTTSYILGYNKNTQELAAYPPNMTGKELLSHGVTDTWTGFYPLIENGLPTSEEVWSQTGNTIIKNPRQVIAQMKDKTIKIFTFRGREDDYPGYTYPEMQDVLVSHGVNFAYNLDGGGSTSTIKSNLMVNPPVDSNFGDLRNVSDFINVKKETSKGYEDFYKTSGDLSHIVKKLEARNISKYGDEIPGRLVYTDFIYLMYDKAIYGKTPNDENKRIIGMYKNEDRIYIGNTKSPMSIQSSHNITVTLGDDSKSYRVNLTRNNEWEKITLSEGIQHHSSRPFQFKEFNAFESRIRGAFMVQGITQNNTVIGMLPSNSAPSHVIVVPVSTLDGERETNDLIIYQSGEIRLRYAPTNPTDTTFVQVETTINRGV